MIHRNRNQYFNSFLTSSFGQRILALLIVSSSVLALGASTFGADWVPRGENPILLTALQTAPISSLALPSENSRYLKMNFRQDYESNLISGRADEFDDDESFGNSLRKEGNGKRHYSVIGAVALSALLPGAGQWYIGNKRGARLFLGAEAGIWTSFVALKVNAGWKQDDVERFATRHAGVSGLNREEQFFRQLTFYSSREEYNSLGRAFDPDLPFIPDSPANDWNWDSPESRIEFRQLFNDQNSADRNADFMFIAAIVNRLTSAALTWRAAQKRNNLFDEDDSEFGSRDEREANYASVRRTTLRLLKPAPGRNASDGLMLALSHVF